MYNYFKLIRTRQILGIQCGLYATAVSFAAAIYFTINFASTFRDRGCGKNGSTVAVSDPRAGAGKRCGN